MLALHALVLLQKLHPPMQVVAIWNVFVFQKADVAVNFKNGQRDIGDRCDTVLAHAFLQIIQSNVLAVHRTFHQLAIVDQDRRLPTQNLPDFPIVCGDFRNHVVHHQQRDRSRTSANHGRVRPCHGILHGIRKQQEQRQVEGRHLPDFTLAAQAHADEYDAVHRQRAKGDLQQDSCPWKDDWIHCVQSTAASKQ